jgi:hypothetical protein
VFKFEIIREKFFFDISGKTDIDLISIYSTYALAVADLVGKRRQMVQVSVDETNGNATTLYWWTGTTLNWVITQEE